MMIASVMSPMTKRIESAMPAIAPADRELELETELGALMIALVELTEVVRRKGSDDDVKGFDDEVIDPEVERTSPEEEVNLDAVDERIDRDVRASDPLQ